jgi:hypothetical protein
VAEQTSGIELMRRRMERARRQPPPPRHRREGAGAGPGEGEATPPPPEPAPAPPRAPAAARPPGGAPRRAPAPEPLRLAADLPPVNLAIRVRRPLDDRLADLIHDLRRAGVRTSKVELIEMLLWELPEGEREGVRKRLRRFREWAPRGPGAPLD